MCGCIFPPPKKKTLDMAFFLKLHSFDWYNTYQNSNKMLLNNDSISSVSSPLPEGRSRILKEVEMETGSLLQNNVTTIVLYIRTMTYIKIIIL